MEYSVYRNFLILRQNRKVEHGKIQPSILLQPVYAGALRAVPFDHGYECLAEFCHPQDIRIGQKREKALIRMAGVPGWGDKVVARQEARACNGAQRQAAACFIFTGLSILAPDDEMIRIGVCIELLFPKSIGQGVERVFCILNCIKGVARDAPPWAY